MLFRSGAHKETIRSWMERHEIPRRAQSEATEIEWRGDDKRREEIGEVFSKANRSIHPSFFVDNEGYNIVTCGVSKEQVRMNRLLATLMIDDISKLKSAHIHHINNIQWDDRISNLELLHEDEHGELTRRELGWENQHGSGEVVE